MKNFLKLKKKREENKEKGDRKKGKWEKGEEWTPTSTPSTSPALSTPHHSSELTAATPSSYLTLYIPKVPYKH